MDLFTNVEIEINSDCNLSCSYCPNSVAKRVERGQMSQELYEKIISELRELNFSGSLSFSFYNEPVLNANLDFYVITARKNLPKCKMLLYSNGIYLNYERFLDLENMGVDNFIITKHENVLNLQIEKFYNQLRDNQKKKVLLQNYSEIQLTNRGGCLEKINSGISTHLLPCQIPQNLVTITVMGNIIPCFEDFFQKNSMGNVRDNKLIEIWEFEKYKKFRMDLKRGLRHKYEACNKCSRTQVLFN